MDTNNERFPKKIESVYAKTLRAGKRRTYFFDVRATKSGEYFLTISESIRRSDTVNEWDRHKIFVYKEDFNRFVNTINEAVALIKTDLMPHYDYDEFTRRQEEYEAALAEERTVRAQERNTHPAQRNYTPPSNSDEEDTKRFFIKAAAKTLEDTPDVDTKSAFKDDDLGW